MDAENNNAITPKEKLPIWSDWCSKYLKVIFVSSNSEIGASIKNKQQLKKVKKELKVK